MNRLADIYGVRSHFNRQGNLANHVPRMRADHAANGEDVGTLVRI